MATIPRVKVGSQGLEVSAIGLGCMGMSSFYGPAGTDEEMIKVIHRAVELGVTFFDSSDVYRPFTNEMMLGKAFKGIRDKVQIATKFSFYQDETGKRSVRGDPEHVRAACEGSLQRLGIDCIDWYYQHRLDTNTPIEVTALLICFANRSGVTSSHVQTKVGQILKVGVMKKLVEEGKVKYLGLSEASSFEIRRAHTVHPITAVQIESSLWVHDTESYIIPTCMELGIGIVPYCPLGRGASKRKTFPTMTIKWILGWGDGYYKGPKENEINEMKKTDQGVREEDQLLRKEVLRELQALVSCSDDDCNDHVTDTMALPRLHVTIISARSWALVTGQHVWLIEANKSADHICTRSQLAKMAGIQTIVCVPTTNGVVELGSTDLIHENWEVVQHINRLFE